MRTKLSSGKEEGYRSQGRDHQDQQGPRTDPYPTQRQSASPSTIMKKREYGLTDCLTILAGLKISRKNIFVDSEPESKEVTWKGGGELWSGA